MNRRMDVATAALVSGFRLAFGTRVGALGARPAKPLELYEFEACPYCRKVREALTVLDLEAIVYPCPQGGKRFRARARELGGKEQFPFLVDPNTGKQLYESDAILAYLYQTYGTGKPATPLGQGKVNLFSTVLASRVRGPHGQRARPSKAPAQPLELWSFEASPHARLAREALAELELPYHLHNVARGSAHRPELVTLGGKMMVPYLVDPNTGAAMYESADIVAYLRRTYGA